MANRLKEDEKNERIIRNLLKLPENKRCINCNSLGPQYVCTSFWTFVCTNCGGIHREFTHRVKSISMAKFTSQEVAALQEGGNKRAKETYLKEFDPQRQSFPDSSNVERLRQFIRHVYVDMRYSGDRNHDRPPRARMGDKDEFYENKSPVGSRSPQYEDAYERRQSGNYRASPSRPSIINDWRRDDRFGDGRKSEDRRDEDSKLEGRLPDRTKDQESSSPPVVRPVREILGESAVPLRVEPPKASSSKAVDGATLAQRTASSSSLGSTNENPPVPKIEKTVSLIDFNDDPGPPPAAVSAPRVQKTPETQPVGQPASSRSDNWASFDAAPSTNASRAPNVNTMDSLLSELSASAPVPIQMSGASIGPGPSVAGAASLVGANALTSGTALPSGAGGSIAPVGVSFSTAPSGGPLTSSAGLLSGGNSYVKVEAGQWPNMQHQQPSVFSTQVSFSSTQNLAPHQNGPSTNQQPGYMPVASSGQMPSTLNMPAVQPLQAISHPGQELNSSSAQPSASETKSSGRKELPADLFTAMYPSFAAPAPGWQFGPPRAMAFYMPYGSAMPLPNYPRPAKSANPFDLVGEPFQHSQNQTFPSMASLQSALPNASPASGLLQNPSPGAAPRAWMPPQSFSHPPGMVPQAAGYPTTVTPRYMSPQITSYMPASSNPGSPGSGASPYGYQHMDQQNAGPFPSHANPARPFSSGGNPFG